MELFSCRGMAPGLSLSQFPRPGTAGHPWGRAGSIPGDAALVPLEYQ